jgi:heptosyltransferase I
LLRLSALGDITHVLPTLRTLQKHWPDTEITWIIGKTEYQLVKAIDDVNFIIFDKSMGFSAYSKLKKDIRSHIGKDKFDVLLHMQLSIRASVASMAIPARIKLGFDKARAKDLQSIFCNRQIQPESIRQHVLESFLEFPRYFGLTPVMKWELPVSTEAVESVRNKLSKAGAAADRKIFVINACAVAKSKNWRNWTPEGYATIADYVYTQHDMQVVLTGGFSDIETDTAEEISRLCKTAKPVSLVAATNIDEMVATLQLADIVLAPDTGPVHIASALNTNTIGLYASTNPQRAGPYRHQQFVANRYPEALQQYHQQTIEQASWGKRIKTAECMKLITVDDVIEKIDMIDNGSED